MKHWLMMNMKAAVYTQKELERISGNIHLNYTYLAVTK